MPSLGSRSSLARFGCGVIALVLVLGGTGYAAKRYVITSKKQISPKVWQQLKGKKGNPGAAGAAGAAGAQGPAGPQGAAGAPGAAGAAGTARGYAQVVTNDPNNPVFDQNHGFPASPRHIDVGKLCIPAPAGVDANTTPVQVSLSGGSIGIVTVRSANNSCRAAEFEIWTGNLSGVFTDGILFNILVP